MEEVRKEEKEPEGPPSRSTRPSMEHIAQETAREYDLVVKELVASGRTQPETRARQKAMVRMYEEGYGPTEIGDFFNRNKGTVVHAVQMSREQEK